MIEMPPVIYIASCNPLADARPRGATSVRTTQEFWADVAVRFQSAFGEAFYEPFQFVIYPRIFRDVETHSEAILGSTELFSYYYHFEIDPIEYCPVFGVFLEPYTMNFNYQNTHSRLLRSFQDTAEPMTKRAMAIDRRGSHVLRVTRRQLLSEVTLVKVRCEVVWHGH